MSFWLPVGASSDLVSGTYRFTFSCPFGVNVIPKLTVPATYRFNGKAITITRSYVDEVAKKYVLELKLIENPEPVTVITIGVLIILGLSAAALVLDKVEKLVDNPAIEFGVFVVAAIAAVALFRSIRKGGFASG